MADLEFIEEGHLYKIGERRLISVTEALQILDDRPKDPWYLQRGRMVHLATELLDRDELDHDSVDPLIQGYLSAYIQFKYDTGFGIQSLIEHPLYHSHYLYAGKMDRIGQLNDCLSIIDLKSGAPAKVDPLQGAAYFELANANGILVKKVFDLYLHDDGTYKLEPIQNPKQLLPVFLAALRIAQWKEKL